MSKLRNKLAEIQKLDDGTYLDTDTGEITDYKPKNTEDMTSDEKLRNVLFQESKKASDDYRDPKYYNKWGKVSPFNILINDSINQIYAMDPRSAADAVVNIIEQLNTTYANDDTYDYISKEYLTKLKMNLSKQRTIDKIVQYLTNIYFKGIGMSMTSQKEASLNSNTITIDISNKDILDKIINGLNALKKRD